MKRSRPNKAPEPTTLPNKILMALGICLVAFVTALFAVGLYREAHKYTYYGPHTDILASGAAITLAQDFSAPLADQAISGQVTSDKSDLKWGSAPKGDIFMARDSRGIVKIDPAWDEDSCYPDRPGAVEQSDGQHKDLTVALPRNLLHR